MEYTQKFKDFLFSLKPSPSKITVKNYSLDVKHFVLWYEKTFHQVFNPGAVTKEHIDLFHKDTTLGLSARSLDRHISSLRKFFQAMKLQGLCSTNPFDAVAQAQENLDPYRLKQFKDFLYVYNASNLTIKNYIIDLRQFLSWAKAFLLKTNPAMTEAGSIFPYVTGDLLSAYREQLISSGSFSPASINRKLSSLRKYVTWAKGQNLLGNEFGLPGNSNIIPNVLSAQQELVPDAILATDQDQMQQQTAVAEQQVAESSHAQKEPSYSPFPPFRLAQKITKGINIALDGMLIAPLAALFLHGHKVLWTLKGKPLFTASKAGMEQALAGINRVKNMSHNFYNPLTGQPIEPTWYDRLWFHARHSRPNWYRRYHSMALAHYFNWAILVIFVAIIGFGLYNSFVTKPENGKPLLAAAQPNRILSFQGRLTDASNTPITTSSYLRFGIYTDATSTGSALLWQELDQVTPDSNGVFSLLLGKNSAIQQSLFANNANLYLGITVGQTPELTPRQQLATVAYATNAETLQGMPPITQGGAGTSNVVLALNSAGNLSIGAASTFQTVGGAFTLSGDTLVLNTNSGTNGNITLSPDGRGFIDLQKPLVNTTQNNNISSAQGSVEVDDTFAILATNSGVPALTINQNGIGTLFTASSGGVSKFTIANSGAVTDANYTTAGGIFYANANGLFLQTTAGTTGQCLTSTGGSAPTWGTCGSGGSGTNFWTLLNGTLYPVNTTLDVLFGGDSSASAKFAFLNNASGTPTASISGNLTLNSVGQIQTTNNQGLTIGGTSTGNITLSPLGGNGTVTISNLATGVVHSTSGVLSSSAVNLAGGVTEVTNVLPLANGGTNSNLTANNGGIVYSDSTSLKILAGTPTAGQCLVSGSSSAPNWTNCSSAASNWWTVSNGALYPINSTFDVFFGGSSSTSAKFAFINDAAGIPTASISGNLTLNSVGQIQTTNNQGLTIGGGSTGNITLSPLGGNGYVTINGTINSSLVPTAGTYNLGSPTSPWNNVYANNIISTGNISGFWQRFLGVLSPTNITDDLAIGGTATGTAKFQVFGNTGNATTAGTLTFTGTGSQIQTTSNQPLTLGGNSTGNIILKPNNGLSGTVNISGAATIANNVTLTSGDLLTGTTTRLTNAGVGTFASGTQITNVGPSFLQIADTQGSQGFYRFYVGINSVSDFAITDGNATPFIYVVGTNQANLYKNGIGLGEGFVTPKAVVHISGGTNGGNAALIVDQTGATTNDILTASASGVTKFTIQNDGTLITKKYTTQNGILYLSDTAGTVAETAQGAAHTFLRGNGASAPTFNSIDLATDIGSSILPIANGGTNTTTIGSAGSVAYSNGTNYAFTAVGSSGFCLVSAGSAAPTWQSCSSAANNNYWTFNPGLGVLYPINSTVDVLFGGTSSSSAKFAFINNAGGTPTASISGNLTLSSAGQIQTTNNQPLTLGGDTTGNIILKPNNGIAGASVSVFADLLPDVTDTRNLGSTSLEWNNLYVKNIISTGNQSGFWQRNLGVISPVAIADDLAIGGVSTASAKFQVFGLTGNSTTAGTLTFNSGAQATNLIAAVNKQGLTIGNSNTGNIIFNGGNVGINDVAPVKSFTVGGTTGEVARFASGGGVNDQNYITVGNARAFFGYNGTNSDIVIQGTSSKGIELNVNNSSFGSGTAVKINNLGFVGLGASSNLGNAQLVVNQTNTSGLGDIFVASASGTTKFVVTNSGSLGVFSGANDGTILASLDVRGNSGTLSVASVSGQTSRAALVVNNDGIGDVFTASSSSIPVFTIAGNGTIKNSLIPNITNTYDLGTAALQWNNVYANNIISNGQVLTQLFQKNANVISPLNISDDLAIGGVSTATAKFQIFGTSGNATTAGTLTFNNSLSQIQTTNNQPLTLGGTSTGNIILSPNNGSGTVTINGAALQTTASTFNAFTTNATTLGLGVTGGTTTVNSALTVTGILTANNNVVLGASGSNTITPNGVFATSLIPQATTVNLGSPTAYYGSAYITNLFPSASSQYMGFWQLNSGALSPTNITNDVLIGGTSTSSAKFQVFSSTGNATTAGTLTFNNSLSQIQTTNNQPLTLGGSSTGNIILKPNNGSGSVSVNGTFNTSLLPTTTDTYDLGSNTLEWNTIYVKNIISSGNLSGFWQRNLGTLSPQNITDDVLAGGTATTSAKFAVLNMTGSGTPTASVSSGLSGTGMYFAADGTIQTVRNEGLTIGGVSTGNITLSPLGGSGTVNVSGALTVSGVFTANNNVVLGATNANTIAANGQFTTSLIPNTTNLYDLGSNTLRWRNLFLSGDSTIAGNETVTGTITAGNLLMSANAQYSGFWQLNAGVLSPTNITNDLAIGGTATSTAKFQVFSATGNATTAGTLTFNNSLSQIQTTNNQPLTLGGSSTGNIILKPNNGSGSVTFSGFVNSNILPVATNAYDLGSLSLQWNNIYGNNIYTNGQLLTQLWQRNAGVLAPLFTSDDLTIGGASTASAKFQIFGNTGNATTTGTLTFNGGINNIIQTTNGQKLTIGSSSTGPIQLSPNGTTGLYVDDAGRVGIGTTAPSAPLQVFPNGNNVVLGDGTNATTYVSISGNRSFVGYDGSSSTLLQSSGSIRLNVNSNTFGSGTTAEFITSGGFVGLNTINPQNQLDVNGGAVIGTYAGTNTSPLNGLAVSGFVGLGTTAVGNTGLVVNQTNLSGLGNIFAASTSGTTKFIITNGGTVGIADNVTDTSVLSKSALDVRRDSFGNALVLFKQLSTDVNADIITASNSAGTTEFRLTNTGIIQARSFQDLDSPSYLLDPAATGNSLLVAGTVGIGTLNPLLNSGLDIEKNALGNAAAVVNQTGNGDIFTASASGVTKFTIQNDGTLITKKYTTQNGILYLSDTAGTVAETAQGAAHTFLRGNGASAPTFNSIDLATADVGSSILPLTNGGTGANITGDQGGILYFNSNTTLTTLAHSAVVGQCLVSNGTAAPSWTSCASASANWWNMNAGSLFPINATLDLLIGANATTSAKFAVLNMTGSGTPTASVSSGLSGNGMYFDANGNVQTVRNATLTLGGNTTGGINIGTDANQRSVLIGNNTLASSVTLTAGTGNINLNAASVNTNQTTIALLNNVATTINFASAAANLTIGATTGITTFATPAIDDSSTGLTLFVTPTTVNFGTASQTLNVKGNLTVGALAADLIPTGNGSINLGSPAHYYGTVYANTFVSPVSGGVAGFWQLSNSVLSPVNAWNDLAVGGNATGSATPWQVFATTVGSVNTAGTATTSGNLTFRGSPTQTLTTKINILNGANLGFYPSVGGDSNTSVFTIANNGDLTATGIFNLNSGTLATSQTSASLFATANTINIGTSGTGGGIGLGNSTGTSTFHGTLQIGDSSTNTLNVAAHISSDLIPDTDNTRNLGTNVLRWKNLFLSGTLTAANINLPATGGVDGYWTLASSVLYPTNNWNDLVIGGTSTASAKFQVFSNTGNATTAGSLTFNTNGLIQTTNMFPLTLGSASTGPIQLSPKGTTGLYVDATGNVGINTTSPTAQLDVAGAASISSTLTFRAGAAAIQATSNNLLTLGGNTTGAIVFGSNVNSNIIPAATDAFNLGSDPTAGGKEWDTLYVRQIVTPSTGGLAGFWQLSNGGVLAPANTANDLAIGGNSTASAAFQIFGRAYTNDLGTVPAGTATVSGNLVFRGVAGAQSNLRVNILNGASLGFFTSPGGDLGLLPANPALFIASSAAAVKIGINTSTPNFALDIASGGTAVSLNNGNNSTSSIAFSGGTTSTGRAYVGYDGSVAALAGTSGHGVKLYTNTGTNFGGTAALTVQGVTGYIDIGTTVAGNAALTVNQTNTSGLGDIITASAAGTTQFVINNNGNVGIGPGVKTAQGILDVASAGPLFPSDLTLGQTTATNWVANPSFESGSPTNTWGFNHTPEFAASNSATESALFGGTALRMDTSRDSGTAYAFTATSQCIPVLGNTAYTESAYYFVKSGFSGNIGLDFQTYTNRDCSSGNSTSGRVNTTTTGSWSRLSSTITTGATVAGIKVRMVADTTPVGIVYADGFQLEQSSSATPYIDGSLGPGYTWDNSGTPNATDSSRLVGSAFAYQTLNSAAGIGAASRGTGPTLQLDQDGSGDIIAASASGITQFQLTNTGIIRANSFQDLSDTRYFIDPAASGIAGTFNGKVGIGTFSPAAQLDVQGGSSIGIAASSSAAVIIAYGALNANQDNIIIRNGAPINSSNYEYVFTERSNNKDLWLYQYDGTTFWNPFKIDGIGQNINLVPSTGSVGIGNTSPNAELSVVNSGATQISGTPMGNSFLVSGGSLATGLSATNNIASIGFKAGSNSVALGVHAFRNTAGGSDWTTANIVLGLDVDNTASAGAFLTLGANSNVGIGTATPATKLQVNGNMQLGPTTNALSAGTNGPVFANVSGSGLQISTLNFGVSTNNGTTPNFVITSAGDVGTGGTPTTGINLDISGNTNNIIRLQNNTSASDSWELLSNGGDSRLFFRSSNPGTTAGTNYVSFNTTGTVTSLHGFSTATPDYAEWIPVQDQSIEAGDVLTANTAATESASKSNTSYQSSVIGIVSTDPGFITGAGLDNNLDPIDTQHKRILALVGRVPTKVSSENGPIHIGDPLTSSSVPGVAMKALKQGPIIGKALANFDESSATQSAQKINGTWVIVNGTCNAGQQDCYAYGKALTFVNVSWYNPDSLLTSTAGFTTSMQNGIATVTDAAGKTISEIGVFAQAVVGNLRAGIITAQNITTNTLAIATSNVTIAGQSLHDYIASVVNEVMQQNGTTSPISSVNQLHAGVISPLGQDDSIALSLANSRLEVKNGASGSAVATIDNVGNATFSGALHSQNLAVNGDATVSGTLHANRIEANTIAGLQAVVSTLSAQNITNVTNLYFASPSGTSTGGNIATGLNTSSSTNSGLLSPYLGYTNLASYSGFLAYVPNLNADTAMFNQGLISLGSTSLADTTVTGQLSIGTNLILANNSVNVLGQSFEIQPLRQGGINLEGGLIAIDTDGNLTVNGNAVFAKNLAANVISPLSNNRDLLFKLGDNPTATGAALATSNLTVQNASGSGIFAINQLGDIAASGEATVGKLNFNFVQPALAVSNTEVIATGSAGTAVVKAHQTEITIDNKLVTNRSLIYITPVGQANVPPYLLRQAPGASFTVGIPVQQFTDTTFNWLIVN